MRRMSVRTHRIVSWTVSAGLALAPMGLARVSHAQQAQTQPNQQADWGPAGPPPDAQNGQVPDQSQDAAPPPSAPPAAAQNPPIQEQPMQNQQSGQQQGQWGQAGPPPDVQNGQVPPPPQNQSQGQTQGQSGRAPYQPNSSRQPYQQPYQAPEQFSLPSGPVTLAPGTLLQIRTSQPLDPKHLQPGDYFHGTLARSVYLNNMLSIPRGAEVTGRVVDTQKAGELKGSSSLTLQITSVNLGGRSYPVTTDTWSMNGPRKGAYTAGNTVGGAALGAIIGGIAGGGPGAAIGAVAGTGVGLGASAATSGPRGVIPPESVLTFRLTQPVTLQPVSAQEARELEQNSAPPRPEYPRGYAPYPPAPYGYYPAPYAYVSPYPYAYPYPYPYAYGYPYPYARYYRYRRY